jgi:hypothetical protein
MREVKVTVIVKTDSVASTVVNVIAILITLVGIAVTVWSLYR